MSRRIQADISEPLPTHGLDVVEVRDAEMLRKFVREWRRLVRSSRRVVAVKPGTPAARRIETHA